jgi:hypothetical protein
MDKYWKFDIERFLEDSKKWGRERRELEREYEALLGLKAISQDTPVQTSEVSDPTMSTSAQREIVKAKLDRLDEKTNLLEKTYLLLSKMEQDCIDTFFFSKGLLGARVDEFTFRWDCQRRTAYNVRRQALEKMREYIESVLK